jgi:ATP phosphoribosyltransferase
MTLYALRPEAETGSLDDAEVVDEFRYGWQFLEQAIALWRLVDEKRADEIEAIKDRVAVAGSDGEPRFDTQDIRELVRLITGVDDAIVAAGIVDHRWRVPPVRLEDLAKRVPGMDLTTERSVDSKTHALGEVMINAVSVRNFLAKAEREGCVVVFG